MNKRQREMFESARSFINNHGGELLSIEYINHKTPLRFVCAYCKSIDERTLTSIRASKANCVNCRYDRSRDKLKMSEDGLLEIYSNYGCKLIGDLSVYKNSKETKLEFICKCGNTSKKSVDDFQFNPMCNECTLDRNSKSLTDMITEFKDSGCKVISYDNTRGVKKIFDFICKCGKRDVKSFNIFRNTMKCRYCSKSDAIKKTTIKNRKSLDDVTIEIKNNSRCQYHSGDYINSNSSIDLICECGNIFTTKMVYFRHEDKKQCNDCGISRRSGENSHKWKGGVTPENQLIRQSLKYKDWRLSVLERDIYTCQKCRDDKGGNLHAHHIYNFSDHVDIRFDINNGITLCNKCHDFRFKGSFHSIYGAVNNDINQLEEFLGVDMSAIRDMLADKM